MHITDDKVELLPTDDLKGLGVYETTEILKKKFKKFNKNIGWVVNGPAGEKLYRAAGIANMDNNGVYSRFSGRGGLGAVMGSNGITAIAIDDSNSKGVPISNEEGLKDIRRTIADTIINNETIANSYTKYGTSNLVKFTDSIGALPNRNFSTGRFERADGNCLKNAMYRLRKVLTSQHY